MVPAPPPARPPPGPGPAPSSSSSIPDFVHPQVKYLYGQEDAFHWSAYPNPDQASAALEQEVSAYNIIHRKKKLDEDGGWSSGSVTIRGRPLKTLGVVLEGYPGVDATKESLTLEAPYKPILHRWEALRKYRDTVKNEESREDASLLISVFDVAMAASGKVIAKLYSAGTIACDKLDLVFSLGEVVVTKSSDGIASAHYLRDFQRAAACWVATLESIDWNGQYFGFRPATVRIRSYRGEVPIESLSLCPLKWLQDQAAVSKHLIARGRQFEALRGYHFKHFDGVGCNEWGGITTPEEGGCPVRGRVVVDAQAYYECQKAGKPALRPIDSTSAYSRPTAPSTGRRQFAAEDFDRDLHDTPLAHPGQWEDHEEFGERQDVTVKRGVVDQPPLTDEQCMVTHTHVMGMDINSRMWYTFYVEDLKDIEWRPEIFQRLVLQDGIKDVALTAIKHKQKANVDVDVVPGKGRGMILLTFGPPGTGKTMTAEAVAEECRVPLYAVSAGELSTDPRSVEVALDAAFRCCALWNAVMLLDEADVFLAKRTPEGLQRNELVSIFLRKLEHYQGILFLTTNRMESVDAAFRSRIDLMLPFDPLTPQARREVWRNFLEVNGGEDRFEVGADVLEELAGLELNGREIKNLIKTALVLQVAEDENENGEEEEGKDMDDEGASGSGGKVAGGSLLKLAKMRIRAQQLLGE
ncbi:P-loop containing nucleoside triphosphate hydrolase [Apiospora saccharicola]